MHPTPPSPCVVRDATPDDFPAVLRMNLESERFLSPMDEPRLRQLSAAAAVHRVACVGDGVAAFLLAFREGANYDSLNYRWFASRYERFLYIDRVVVDAAYQGRQLGGELYRDVFGIARQWDLPLVVCEFDVEPPNEASRRFHARFGFAEVGEQRVGTKKVSLQAASLAAGHESDRSGSGPA